MNREVITCIKFFYYLTSPQTPQLGPPSLPQIYQESAIACQNHPSQATHLMSLISVGGPQWDLTHQVQHIEHNIGWRA